MLEKPIDLKLNLQLNKR